MKSEKKTLTFGLALIGISFVAGIFAVHNVSGMELWFATAAVATGVVGVAVTTVGIIGFIE